MANYEKRYALISAPQARTDGSGMVDHDIQAEAQPQGASNEWAAVPGRHKTISIPEAEIQAALAQPTNPQKNQAYIDALVANVNTQPSAVTGWGNAQIEALLDANDLAGQAAADADEYITVTLGLSYPVPFTI